MGAVPIRDKPSVRELALFPVQIDGNPAARPQTGDGAFAPSDGQRREQLNLAALRLEQHLRNARGATEVAVNLKRRMSVEKIGVSALGSKQKLQYSVGVFSVVQPRPKIKTPPDGP